LDKVLPPLPEKRPSLWLGAAVSALAIALATAAIYPLKSVAPVVSLSVVYLPAVLLVSSLWGVLPGLATSLASAAAFNFFHIEPVSRFTISDSRNWVALAAFTTVAIVTSWIAELARSRSREAERRRAEADLAAQLARELLAGADTRLALAAASHWLAVALGLTSATIELGTRDGDDRRRAIPLSDGGGSQLATLLVPKSISTETAQRLRDSVEPTLSALVAIALRRDQIQAEAVETAALRHSDEVKTALLRAVSHDLRTPLTAIVAAGHALSSASLTDEDRSELAAAVVTEGERLASMVEKLLDLSRLQAGGSRPKPAWVSIEDVVLAARETLETPRGDIRIAIPPDLPEVRADADQLERVFANLLENASRHGGGAPVAVTAAHVGDRVVISVVDQGPGFPSADRERIFEPFYRGAGAAHDTGSGLGLAIARGFVEAAGGTLTSESLPGQGTSFVVSLALERPGGGAPGFRAAGTGQTPAVSR
jgi:two-component system sensor histidine kinase KdpD